MGGELPFAAFAQSLEIREESSHSRLEFSICLSAELDIRVSRLP
jgi:hypothetical protein